MSAHLPEYEPMYALAELMLGILHSGDHVERLVQCPRADAKQSADGPLADALLGFIALQRTLRVCIASELAPPSSEPAPSATPAREGLLR